MGAETALIAFAASSALGTANTIATANSQKKFANAQATAARRRTLFESDAERRKREERLKRLRAAARASAAGRGVSGTGGSAAAIVDGLNSQAATADREARQRTAFDLNDIETGRRHNLLELADRQRRAAIGLLGDAGRVVEKIDT